MKRHSYLERRQTAKIGTKLWHHYDTTVQLWVHIILCCYQRILPSVLRHAPITIYSHITMGCNNPSGGGGGLQWDRPLESTLNERGHPTGQNPKMWSVRQQIVCFRFLTERQWGKRVKSDGTKFTYFVRFKTRAPQSLKPQLISWHQTPSQPLCNTCFNAFTSSWMYLDKVNPVLHCLFFQRFTLAIFHSIDYMAFGNRHILVTKPCWFVTKQTTLRDCIARQNGWIFVGFQQLLFTYFCKP